MVNQICSPTSRNRNKKGGLFSRPEFAGEDLNLRPFIYGERLADSDYCKADTPGNLLPVGHYERQILFLSSDSDPFQRPFRNPRVLTPRIYEDLGNAVLLFPIGVVLNNTMRMRFHRAECSMEERRCRLTQREKAAYSAAFIAGAP